MKNIIENTVKYGIPLIVVLIFIYALILDNNHPGDPEFGAWGAGIGIILILFVFILLYLIAGIIVWKFTGKNFIFLSGIFSLAAILMVVLFFAIKAKT